MTTAHTEMLRGGALNAAVCPECSCPVGSCRCASPAARDRRIERRHHYRLQRLAARDSKKRKTCKVCGNEHYVSDDLIPGEPK